LTIGLYNLFVLSDSTEGNRFVENVNGVEQAKEVTIETRYGQRLREFRQELGLSLRNVARRAGIHPTYLSKIELGHLPPPSPTVQGRIDSALTAILEDRLVSERKRLEEQRRTVFQHELLLIARFVEKYESDGAFRDALLYEFRGFVSRLEAPRTPQEPSSLASQKFSVSPERPSGWSVSTLADARNTPRLR
jgi:transcriptional regulator with XRE-family HTH domain